MSERIRSSAGYENPPSPGKMTDLGPRKSFLVLVIVVGCFAVLWPKVFYPMLVGSAKQHMQPSAIDKKTGCCDVISEIDVHTIKILSELCSNIIHQTDEKPLSGKEIVTKCRSEILQTCGIDISAILQEQVRLGYTVKQILNEIRSLNGSLCLKYNFGVAPWRLGVPHRITIKDATQNVRQERPPLLKPEMIHPAFQERGRAIPQPQAAPSRPPTPRIVEGKPGPIPSMRPPMGGAGHVVPPSQKGNSSMGVIMPIYTIGIVIFFTYTLMKVLFKKQPEGVGGDLYPNVQPDHSFRTDVFESEKCRLASRYAKEGIGRKLVVNAMSALLDEVDQELEIRRKMKECANQDEQSLINGGLSNGSAPRTLETDQDQAEVKVLGMETTASCEGGQKWSRPESPVVPVAVPLFESTPPQAIYLEGALPAQSQLLVADSATEAQPNEDSSEADPAVVLAGKMTLSVISLDSAQDESNGAEIQEELAENGLNGFENSEDILDESKYTTVSSATAAENDISDEERTDDENEDHEEIQLTDEENLIAVDEFNGKIEENHIIDEVAAALEDEINDRLRNEENGERNEGIVQNLGEAAVKVNEENGESNEDLIHEHGEVDLTSEKINEENGESSKEIVDLLEESNAKIDEKIDLLIANEKTTPDLEETLLAEDLLEKVHDKIKEQIDLLTDKDEMATNETQQESRREETEVTNSVERGEEDPNVEYEYEIEEIEVDDDYDGDDEIIEVVEVDENQEAAK